MNSATQRLVLRWLHIIVTIPIFGYIYGPAAEVQEYAGAVRYLFVPVIVLLGLWMYAGSKFRHHRGGVIARDLLFGWLRGGCPECGRAFLRAENLADDSGAKFRLTGVESLRHEQEKNDAMKAGTKKELTGKEREGLLKALRARFEKNMDRHQGLDWVKVRARLEGKVEKLWSLHEMERTGGEPDVVGHDKKTSEYLFFDCSPESPKGRVAVCYDREGLESRKEHRPKDTAIDMAAAMGVELLTEEEYHALQKLGEFDLKTTTWVKTPVEIRKLGGALFGDRRYGRVFICHNGAQSYYSARGFRSSLRV